MSKFSAPPSSILVVGQAPAILYPEAKPSTSEHPDVSKILFHCREPDGQASGGDGAGNDDWIFNTIREKDLKKVQNGAVLSHSEPFEHERKQVRPYTIVEG